ncbi:MAG: tRNA (adenosine(37)-N6)-threonylcarbamoyltransferase complex ATPase subunit type 1 TsaE [Caldilineaceae bacterium]|nr:tRNA (adenosine(37)-N6)-threonylcarbamoyltransferase complex ATPase subunit type 1 TsaE [Caldilineaceae bacterium]
MTAAPQYILHLDSPAKTFDLGRCLGEHAAAGQVIALCGDLGAGKTTLSQGVAAGMGVSAQVTSPTFTLVAEYLGSRGLRLIHIDTYRLGDAPAAAAREAATFGLEEIVESAAHPDADSRGTVVVIEWAERVAALLPADRLTIVLTPDGPPDARRATLTAHGPQSAQLLAAIQRD